MERKIRRQLTLFVDKRYAEEIEYVRKRFNPKQQELIDSHVTLCRENEIENLDGLIENLQQLDSAPISINFGRVIRFYNNTGVMLPALPDNIQFHLLRSKILAGIAETINTPEPHITLMHPRNSTCTDEIFSAIKEVTFPKQLTFDTVSMIEQLNGGKWSVIDSYKLNGS